MKYQSLQRYLFRLDPEQAHTLTLTLLRLVGALPPLRHLLKATFAVSGRNVSVFGLDFPNPLGLAAGYDKDGLAWRGLACLGFGHIELGTVTPQPQPGNPRPRLFRIPEEGAIINRMGFPSRGAAYLANRLRVARPSGLILGVNIGKNKDTPLEEAAEDYVQLVNVFAPLADYLTINVSSPNTVGLRRLQGRQALGNLLNQVAQARAARRAELGRSIPLLVKLAPDLSTAELEDALDAILASGIDGVIATNTTLSRQGLRSPLASESGGLSGAPLRERSTEIIRKIHGYTQGKLPVVAAGGIMSAADAQQKLDAGATLLQVYTGLIYTGPGLIRQIIQETASPRV